MLSSNGARPTTADALWIPAPIPEFSLLSLEPSYLFAVSLNRAEYSVTQFSVWGFYSVHFSCTKMVHLRSGWPRRCSRVSVNPHRIRHTISSDQLWLVSMATHTRHTRFFSYFSARQCTKSQSENSLSPPHNPHTRNN